MSCHVAHLSYGNCRVRVNGVMTTWPPRYFQRVNCFGFRAKTGVLTLSSVVKNANGGVCAEENGLNLIFFQRTLMILSLLVSKIYGAS